ncbi:hypothetical protein K440DRAFT_641435 [Wilcoxina mikolae CBS 423.85]|nr:hypothetical protein K440DRAFT_641435 [Wilcoxina mikolae CBS 423.85]
MAFTHGFPKSNAHWTRIVKCLHSLPIILPSDKPPPPTFIENAIVRVYNKVVRVQDRKCIMPDNVQYIKGRLAIEHFYLSGSSGTRITTKDWLYAGDPPPMIHSMAQYFDDIPAYALEAEAAVAGRSLAEVQTEEHRLDRMMNHPGPWYVYNPDLVPEIAAFVCLPPPDHDELSLLDDPAIEDGNSSVNVSNISYTTSPEGPGHPHTDNESCPGILVSSGQVSTGTSSGECSDDDAELYQNTADDKLSHTNSDEHTIASSSSENQTPQNPNSQQETSPQKKPSQKKRRLHELRLQRAQVVQTNETAWSKAQIRDLLALRRPHPDEPQIPMTLCITTHMPHDRFMAMMNKWSHDLLRKAKLCKENWNIIEDDRKAIFSGTYPGIRSDEEKQVQVNRFLTEEYNESFGVFQSMTLRLNILVKCQKDETLEMAAQLLRQELVTLGHLTARMRSPGRKYPFCGIAAPAMALCWDFEIGEFAGLLRRIETILAEKNPPMTRLERIRTYQIKNAKALMGSLKEHLTHLEEHGSYNPRRAEEIGSVINIYNVAVKVLEWLQDKDDPEQLVEEELRECLPIIPLIRSSEDDDRMWNRRQKELKVINLSLDAVATADAMIGLSSESESPIRASVAVLSPQGTTHANDQPVVLGSLDEVVEENFMDDVGTADETNVEEKPIEEPKAGVGLWNMATTGGVGGKSSSTNGYVWSSAWLAMPGSWRYYTDEKNSADDGIPGIVLGNQYPTHIGDEMVENTTAIDLPVLEEGLLHGSDDRMAKEGMNESDSSETEDEGHNRCICSMC